MENPEPAPAPPPSKEHGDSGEEKQVTSRDDALLQVLLKISAKLIRPSGKSLRVVGVNAEAAGEISADVFPRHTRSTAAVGM